MKTPYVVGLVMAAVLLTVAIEEGRMSALRGRLEEAGGPGAAARGRRAAAAAGPKAVSPRRETGRVREDGKSGAGGGAADGDLGKTVRKMWDNPTGRSMMKRNVRFAVGMLYEDFIEGLELTREEEAYFKELLGEEMAARQELGMKMMGASREEIEELGKELEAVREKTEEDVETFLNSEEDFAAFRKYRDRLPERQQITGIEAVMESRGVAMDEETSEKLVDALHKVRTGAGAVDFSGRNAMEELSKGGAVERYEEGWAKQQEMLMEETAGFLSEEQQEALAEQQKQMKEMQLMGLRMAEKMMSPSE